MIEMEEEEKIVVEKSCNSKSRFRDYKDGGAKST